MKEILKKIALYPDKKDFKSLIISFILVNIAFLYHTLNFMWGNHDVAYMREPLLLTSGVFEGRFSQFILPYFLVKGQILPIVTNVLGLFFLTLGLWLLARYWKIPKSCLNYVIFITFFATEPYTLAWFYFTFITLSCLSWVFFCVLGLYISEKICLITHKFRACLFAIVCFYLPLGGYPPVINTIGVCFLARIVLAYLVERKNILELINVYKYTIFNVLVAAICVKFTLYFVTPDDVYNLGLISLSDVPQKFIATIGYAFKQFVLSQPFMEKGYKYLLLLMVVIAFTGAVVRASGIKQRLTVLLLLFALIWTTSLTTFLVIPPTQYIARVDFYGVAFVYAFALAMLLSFERPLAKSLAVMFMAILIPFNVLNDYRALKIWQQGFDAEMKILDDIYMRLEDNPAFDSHKKYRFYQAGDISLRPAYYQKKYEQPQPFLLMLPYLAIWQGAVLSELYSASDFIDHKMPILPEDITPEVHEFISKKAQPYPHKNSVFVSDNIIIIVYNQYGLDLLKEKIFELYR